MKRASSGKRCWKGSVGKGGEPPSREPMEKSVPSRSRWDPSPSPPIAGQSGARLSIMVRTEEEPEEEEQNSFGGILARSPSMRRIFRVIDLLRDNDSTVLVTGESGTGKELVARAVHETSHRKEGPFVAVNCAALPSELMESELFGHVRGAFTGAIKDKPGRFEIADGGTLFLDEIGDLALPLQAKLLRALQEHEFERVGDTRTRKVDVRVIAATGVDLGRAVSQTGVPGGPLLSTPGRPHRGSSASRAQGGPGPPDPPLPGAHRKGKGTGPPPRSLGHESPPGLPVARQRA